jgi:chlorite dismutase
VSAFAGRTDSLAFAFERFATATAPHRQWFEPGETLWGLTRPSPYVRKSSSTTIDPIDGERLPYLFVYPFVKTHDWYALEMEERRKLMGEHIQVGRRFGDVNQLLLYAFGLQDQDFVVVYEGRDPARFSELVQELRGTAARAYTARDTPILTAVHRSDEELARLFDD